MSKRINISSKFLKVFSVGLPNGIAIYIPTGNPLTGASNAGGVGRNRDYEPIFGFTVCVKARTDHGCCKHDRRWTTATVSQVVTHRW